MTLRVVQNDDLYRTRMYDSFKASWRGWSRIFYGCFGSLGRLMAGFWLLALMSVLPYFAFATAGTVMIVNGGQMSGLGWLTLAVSGVAVAAQQTALARFYGLTGSKWYEAVTYPIGAVLALEVP